jgi:hypothetical protein
MDARDTEALYQAQAQSLIAQATESARQTELATLRGIMAALAMRIYQLQGVDPRRVRRVEIFEE